jgi:serine/threonine protein kinase
MAPTERLVAAGYTGKLVAGRYKLERMLGAGAVGEVWLAEHIHMRKRYALKLLDPRIATPEITARFEREAVAAANIMHPSVVAGTDFGKDEDGSFFLVLEYVNGVSLRKLIEAGPVTPKRALGIARQVLQAVGAAHVKGVVHRDLKPENVMIVERDDIDPRVATSKDTIKVLDFGIAKVDPNSVASRKSVPPPENLTRAGTVWGTPTYMAPEQAVGEPVDARADIYAVGVVIYEMITGKPPFEGEPLEVIAHQVNEDAPPLAKKAPADTQLTPELEATVGALLRRPRDERPADVNAAITLIDAAERSLGTAPARVVVDARPSMRPAWWRNRALVGAIAAIVVLTSIILVVATRAPPEGDEETKPHRKHSAGHASASTTASTASSPAPSAPASATATGTATGTATAKKPTSNTPSNEKGFGKLKSLFK